MAHTYSSRLTIVHPELSNLLDPRVGIVIAETAASGRYIIGDIEWESFCAPNSTTLTTFNGNGSLKIYEPLGMSLYDYIKAGAYQLQIDNHLDARFLLEIEVISENMPESGSQYKYIWPIMLATSECKSTVTEKGTEYEFRFIHTNHHAQTDLVQPIKDTIKLEAETLQEYFQKLQNKLEDYEYMYARAGQKAGKAQSPGGDNPASKDDFHDEYHFVLQKEIQEFEFTSKGKADPGYQKAWFGFGNKWNITARPGTTLVQLINQTLQRTEDAASLLLGKSYKFPNTSVGSDKDNVNKIQKELGKVYKFFRIETTAVYKAFDYVRQRYAVKHVFFIFLADQPNMYQYPDEIALINMSVNKDAAIKKLQTYIKDGLLQKLYYHHYTGMNTDIIKVNLEFNQLFSLPSFPQVWADRHEAGPGQMNLDVNNNRRLNPFAAKTVRDIRSEIAKINKAASLNAQRTNRLISKYGKGDANEFARYLITSKNTTEGKLVREQYEEQQSRKMQYEEFLQERREELNTKLKEDFPTSVKSRSDLLKNLNFLEDLDGFQTILEESYSESYANLNPRMESDSKADESLIKQESEKIIEKVYSVLISPRDLIDLELEVFADPYWLGMPNVLSQGSKVLTKDKFSETYSEAIVEMINSKMKTIDPFWDIKEPTWSDYGVATWYKGAPLFYFLSQNPDNLDDTDLLKFTASDQIAGIYMVWSVTNIFKDGKWTQRLKAKRDITIPTQFIPKALPGQEYNFETFISQTLQEEVTQELITEETSISNRDAEATEAGMANVPGQSSGNTVSLSKTNTETSIKSTLATALTKQNELLDTNPPPTVDNPVDYARTLVDDGVSKKEAYKEAKTRYENQLDNYFNHMTDINKQSYGHANITEFIPYSAGTMKALALQKDGIGGLNNWKDNITTPSPSSVNNPMAIGGNLRTGQFAEFNSFQDGLKAGNNYYNFGVGVPGPASKLLLPTKITSSVSKELLFLKIKGGK